MYVCFFALKLKLKITVWRSYYTDSALDFWQRSSIPCAHSVSMGGNGDFEKWGLVRHFCTYRPEILHTPRGRQYAQLCQSEFWISSPEKFGASLNFAFALRPMGRKISNRLYSSLKSSFGLIFSGLLGWMCESLFWDFLRFLRMGRKFLTRFFSISVCFTPPLIFPEPLKLAH